MFQFWALDNKCIVKGLYQSIVEEVPLGSQEIMYLQYRVALTCLPMGKEEVIKAVEHVSPMTRCFKCFLIQWFSGSLELAV